jgi:hypothetical protein
LIIQHCELCGFTSARWTGSTVDRLQRRSSAAQGRSDADVAMTRERHEKRDDKAIGKSCSQPSCPQLSFGTDQEV